jgi:hypothetical protein
MLGRDVWEWLLEARWCSNGVMTPQARAGRVGSGRWLRARGWLLGKGSLARWQQRRRVGQAGGWSQGGRSAETRHLAGFFTTQGGGDELQREVLCEESKTMDSTGYLGETDACTYESQLAYCN